MQCLQSWPALNTWEGKMTRAFSILLTVLICLVALGQFVQVITRYVAGNPGHGA